MQSSKDYRGTWFEKKFVSECGSFVQIVTGAPTYYSNSILSKSFKKTE